MSLEAYRCPNGHLALPRRARCRECGERFDESIDLTSATGEIVTWTVSTATPPGVREPNPLAIVEFTVDETPVRVLGGLTTAEVDIGDAVEPVAVDELRDPDAGIRWPASQAWNGYRFRPV